MNSLIDINEAKKARTPRKKARWGRMIFFFLLLVAFIMLLATIVRYVSFLGLDMTAVEERTVFGTAPCEVIVVRAEYPITVGASGNFTPEAEEGAKVHAGIRIGSVSGENGETAVYADRSGLVLYDLDGWEMLSPYSMFSTAWQSVFAAMRGDEQEPAEAEAPEIPEQAQDRQVAKLLDNLERTYICVYAAEDISPYLHDEDILYLGFPELGDDTTIEARLVIPEDYEEDEDEEKADVLARLIRESDHYYVARLITEDNAFQSMRYTEATLKGETFSGLSVPASAIVQDAQGNTGVFVSNKRKLAYTEVTVLYKNDDMAIVEGLKNTDEVAASPQHAHEGQKIY